LFLPSKTIFPKNIRIDLLCRGSQDVNQKKKNVLFLDAEGMGLDTFRATKAKANTMKATHQKSINTKVINSCVGLVDSCISAHGVSPRLARH
jgi:hypothetical protein